MKKVSLFMIAAVFAASAVFVSCTKEENDPPKITVNLNGTDQNSITVKGDVDVNVKIDFNADAGIKQIDLKIKNGSNVTGFPKTKDFKSANFDQITFKVDGMPAGGSVEYLAEITDKDNNSTNRSFTITFTKVDDPGGEDTPLGAATEFTFAYQGSGHDLNNLNLDALGMVAAYATTPGVRFNFTGSFVILNATEFGAIATKEALKAKFEGGTAATTIAVTLEPIDSKKYFIAKKDQNYFLVETIEIVRNIAVAPANKVTISYKQ
jgi:hypothetical protein